MGVRVIDETKKVKEKMDAANLVSLRDAAAYIRGVARQSIGRGVKKNTKRAIREGAPETTYTPSKPGKPPHSPKGVLKRAIVFSVVKKDAEAVVGPARSVIGEVAHTHEGGGQEPAKKHRRSVNWEIKIGGHGPIRSVLGKPVGYAKLKTAAQVRQADTIAAAAGIPEWERGKRVPRTRNFPARPFMGPALEISRERIPSFWRSNLNRS